MSSGTIPLRLARTCLARTRPSTTGFTNSRWLGLNASDRWIFLPDAVTRSNEWPRWYLTSPRPRFFSGLRSLNAAKTSRRFFSRMLTSTLRRPRWAMPMTISSTPCADEYSTKRSSIAIMLSAPSSEKRLAPTKFLWTNCSKISASVRRVRMRRTSSRSSAQRLRVDSIEAWSQVRAAGSSTCVNSTPIEPQYVSVRWARISRSVARSGRPEMPSVRNDVSSSCGPRPKLASSSSGAAAGGLPSGSMRANRWPRTRYALTSW